MVLRVSHGNHDGPRRPLAPAVCKLPCALRLPCACLCACLLRQAASIPKLSHPNVLSVWKVAASQRCAREEAPVSRRRALEYNARFAPSSLARAVSGCRAGRPTHPIVASFGAVWTRRREPVIRTERRRSDVARETLHCRGKPPRSPHRRASRRGRLSCRFRPRGTLGAKCGATMILVGFAPTGGSPASVWRPSLPFLPRESAPAWRVRRSPCRLGGPPPDDPMLGATSQGPTPSAISPQPQPAANERTPHDRLRAD